MFFAKKKKTNVWKVIAITLGCVLIIGIIAFIIYKLVKKYTEDLVYDCDDLLEGCEDCDVAIEDADEVVEA